MQHLTITKLKRLFSDFSSSEIIEVKQHYISNERTCGFQLKKHEQSYHSNG